MTFQEIAIIAIAPVTLLIGGALALAILWMNNHYR
jgi:hypothetical protein